ncbi:MAG TPA: hypothetical protein VFU03_02580, partial [Gemmatimonadales bacterium]|nr:hypothetical protein [Gemmatimonadales bacterium]
WLPWWYSPDRSVSMLALMLLAMAAAEDAGVRCDYVAIPGQSLGPVRLGTPLAKLEAAGAKDHDGRLKLGDYLSMELDVDDRVQRVWISSGTATVCLAGPEGARLDLGDLKAPRRPLFPDCTWRKRGSPEFLPYFEPAWYCPTTGAWYKPASMTDGERAAGYFGLQWGRGKAPAPTTRYSLLLLTDNTESTEEHCYGSRMEVYELDGKLVGLYMQSEGLCGDSPTAAIEDGTWDPKTGRYSFRVRMRIGSDGQGGAACMQQQFSGTIKKRPPKGKTGPYGRTPRDLARWIAMFDPPNAPCRQ